MVTALVWLLATYRKIFKNSVSNPFPIINERDSPKCSPYLSITLWNTVKSKFLIYDGIHLKIGVIASHGWILSLEWGEFDVH